jgi:hypothetical protein
VTRIFILKRKNGGIKIMTALTSTQIANLNRMNRASTSAAIGTRLNNLETGAVVAGSHVVTSAQASASAITVQTTVSAIEGKMVQATRSGSQIYGVKCLTTGSNLNITSASPSLWVIAENDEVNYVVW